jgi:PAS domain S-box-containing protein
LSLEPANIPDATLDERPSDELAVAREALRQSGEILRATFEQAAVGIGVVALDGRYTDVNAKFAAIVGYSPEELKERRVWDITHPDDLALSRSLVADLLAQTVRDVVQEKRYVRNDGSVVWSRTSVSLMKDPVGQPQRFISVIEDITERRCAEEALARSNEFNRSIVESSRDCLKTLTLEGVLLWLSDTGRRALCVDDLREVIGKSWIDFWRGDDRVAAQAAVQAAASGSSGTFVGRYDLAGVEHWWEVVVTPIRDATGRPETLLAVSRDITERIRAEDERRVLLESERAARAAAEHANRMKDEFLATLSHELRTPLSAIIGWSHVLRSGRASPADVTRGVEAIERNARVQTQLIEELLDMSRITSGKMRLEMQPLDPVVFVEAAFDAVRPAAEARRIRLEKQVDSVVDSVCGDGPRLQQVVSNLLSNAVKFTPEGGRVSLSLQQLANAIQIRVSDTGVGIEPAFMTHLFERFRQADGTTARRYGGLGLGLAIVKHIVDMHGGEVRAESAGTGTGSTFTVHIPLAPAAEPQDARPAKAMDFHGHDLTGVRILVVDDDEDGRDLVQRLLAECGASVVAANGGEEALQQLAGARVDLIVSDIGMPGMDGYELLRRIRALDAHVTVPVVAFTAFARPEDRTRLLRAGFAAHATKPVEPTELLSSLAQLVGR